MRDSRLGTYGALILMVSFVTKLSALAALPDAIVVQSLIAAHALARGVLPVMSMGLPYARQDGLAANAAGPISRRRELRGHLRLLLPCWRCREATRCGRHWWRPPWRSAWHGWRNGKSAGQTGDVLGGAEQLGETAILVLLAARLA